MGFAPALLTWVDTHGRHDLPWQQAPTPYRVWVSEVMLQQTQVTTVIPYYARFIARFPDVVSLASAPIDEVLHFWTGLGYYARARNLHRAASIVVQQHGERVPEDFDTLQDLPGIGRSTAGAILALSRNQRHPILDGNARRVIARHFAVEGHIGDPATQRRLWEIAEACTPHDRIAAYTQAIMDLGATVCTRTRPACDECPLRDTCIARATGRQTQLPSPPPRRVRPHRSAVALIASRDDGAVLLQQRPNDGLWGGLWTFPQFDTEDEALSWLALAGLKRANTQQLAPYEHAFTHYDLTLRLLATSVMSSTSLPDGCMWYDPSSPQRVGLTKPVTALLAMLRAGAQAVLV